MATTSEVKVGLDAIAKVISDQRAVMQKVKSNAGLASEALALLPTTYADVIDTINGYGNADAFEAHAKAEFAKLVDEFIALKADADTVAAVDLG